MQYAGSSDEMSEDRMTEVLRGDLKRLAVFIHVQLWLED